MKQIAGLLLCAVLALCVLAGCAGGNDTEMGDGEKMLFTPIVFDNITACDDVVRFIAQVDYADGTHNNEAKDVGMILSPYFTMTAGEWNVPCYAVRTSIGAHSFAMIDVASDAVYPMEVTVQCETDGETVTVLPTTHGVVPEALEGGIRASLPSAGIYTFVIGDDKTRALTVFLREYAPYAPPEGYDVVRIAPGVHDEKIAFTQEKQVLYFERGVHELKYNIDFLDNTEVYLESGAYLFAVMPDRAETPWQDPDWAGMTRWNALFQGDGVSNVRISGRGVVDLSRLDWHARSAVRFDASDKITVEGITLNNSPEWTVYFTQCEDITVEELLLFGYRQNSDGVCMVDCRNALTKNCFARSGDDLFEVKSMYGNCTIPIENIRFEGCQAWPDKARGIGIIAESVRDLRDIHFVGCSVGYASAEWMDALGSVVVYLTGGATVDDITFEDIEIFSSVKYPINVTVENGASAVIENVYFRNIDICGDRAVRIADNTDTGAIRNLWFDDCERDGVPIADAAGLLPYETNTDSTLLHIDERNDGKGDN